MHAQCCDWVDDASSRRACD